MIVARETVSKWMRVYVAVFIGLVGLLMVHRWRQGEIYYFDHGIFDQALWQVAHGKPPLIDHIDIYPLHQLGDHFTPSLYLLTPLYWLTNNYEPLFVIMALFLGLTVGVVYLTGLSLKLPPVLSGAIAVALSLFLGWQNGAIAGFHTEIPALLSLALALLALEKKKWRWFWVLILITLGFKETFVAISAALGVFLMLRAHWKHGLVLVLFSLIYWQVVTKEIIPLFRGGLDYYYQMPQQALWQEVKGLLHPDKIKTVGVSLASFAGLPLLAPFTWPLLLQDWVVRFGLGTSAAWELKLHYSLISGLLLAYSALHGVVGINNLLKNRVLLYLLCLLLVLIPLVVTWRLQGPYGLLVNNAFYTHSETMRFLDTFAGHIPNNGLVMTQNNLMVRLTHTHNVMLLREDYDQWMPDVIAIDIRSGQSPNNHWPLQSTQMFERLESDSQYTQHALTPDQYIYTKN